MSVRRSLVWSYGGQAVMFLTSFGTSVVVARLLDPRDLGIYALSSALAAILAIFTSFGIHAYIVRAETVDRSMLRSVFTVNISLAFVAAAALFIASAVETALYGEGEVAGVLRIIAIAPLFSAFEFVPSAMSMREMRYDLISSVNVLRSLVTAAVVLTFAFLGYGAESLALGPVVAGAVCALTFTALRWRDAVFRPLFRDFRPILTFGFQMMSISGVAQLCGRACDLILGRVLGLPALGLYARASNLANMIFSNVYGLATGLIFSEMSRELREEGTVHRTFLHAIRMITAVMWPLLIGLAVLSGPAVKLLYGPRWLGAAAPLSMLMIAQFVVIGFGMNWELFVLRKETALQTRFEFVRAVACLIFFSVGSFFGVAAAAAARIVEAAFGYALYRPHMDRMAGVQRGELERVYGESFVLTVAAAAPSALLMAWTRFSPDTPIWQVGAAVAAGVVAWAAVLRLRQHPIATELDRVLRRVTGRRAHANV